MNPATRQDVERYWLDVVAGRLSVREASAWAERHLDRNDDVEELVIQGLLFLQHQRFSIASDEDGAAHISKVLDLWRVELTRFDDDPDGWERARLRRILTGFLESHGIEAARAFGRRMVKAGILREPDVDEALAVRDDDGPRGR